MREPRVIVQEARDLFNEKRFWHVHESLEELWLVRKGKEKEMLQGLILIAASLVHAGNGKMDVCWPMMEKALGKLEDPPEDYFGWPVATFRAHYKEVLSKRELQPTRV